MADAVAAGLLALARHDRALGGVESVRPREVDPMPSGDVIDWIFRGVFVVMAAIWGRNQKLADDLMESKAADLKRLVQHDRDSLSVLVDVKATALERAVDAKATALERSVSDKSHALDRLFESQFALRDERIGAIAKQLEDAAERASTAASKLTGKLGEVDHRLTVLETKQAAK